MGKILQEVQNFLNHPERDPELHVLLSSSEFRKVDKSALEFAFSKPSVEQFGFLTAIEKHCNELHMHKKKIKPK